MPAPDEPRRRPRAASSAVAPSSRAWVRAAVSTVATSASSATPASTACTSAPNRVPDGRPSSNRPPTTSHGDVRQSRPIRQLPLTRRPLGGRRDLQRGLAGRGNRRCARPSPTFGRPRASRRRRHARRPCRSGSRAARPSARAGRARGPRGPTRRRCRARSVLVANRCRPGCTVSARAGSPLGRSSTLSRLNGGHAAPALGVATPVDARVDGLVQRAYPPVGERRVADDGHDQQVARARGGDVGQAMPLVTIALDFERLVIEQIGGRPSRQPHGAQSRATASR